MNRSRTICYLSIIFLLGSFITVIPVLSQPPEAGSDQAPTGEADQMGSPTDQEGLRGDARTQRDPERMQQMMTRRYQELLGMSDEEWAVIGPYVLRVSTLSSSTQSRGMGIRTIMGARGSRTVDGATEDREDSQNQNRRDRAAMMGTQDENLQALQTLLEDENATSDEIKTKLSALRKARETAKQEMAMAQKDLRELLTLRQEAMLVIMGLLE